MLNTDQIQARTTNHIPAVDPTPGRLPYLVDQADTAREHTARLDLDRLTAALPAAVDEAMRKTLPGEYTPQLAAGIAAEMIARLTGAKTNCPVFADCTDTEPGHHDHHNHGIKVTGEDGDTILDIGMVGLSGSEQHAIVYLRNEEFTDAAALNAKTMEINLLLDAVNAMGRRVLGVDTGLLASVDQQIADDTRRLIDLDAERRRIAIQLKPAVTPFEESAGQQTASAAFSAATRCMDVALAKSGDRAGTLRALRTFLDMAEAEQA